MDSKVENLIPRSLVAYLADDFIVLSMYYSQYLWKISGVVTGIFTNTVCTNIAVVSGIANCTCNYM
jgi:hypothetical protein